VQAANVLLFFKKIRPFLFYHEEHAELGDVRNADKDNGKKAEKDDGAEDADGHVSKRGLRHRPNLKNLHAR
jgi:hypothetical protein